MIKKIIFSLLSILVIVVTPAVAGYSQFNGGESIVKQPMGSDRDINCPSGQHLHNIHEKCQPAGCIITSISCS